MRVSPRQAMGFWSNGTGRQPEAVVLRVASAVAAEAVVAALHVADLVSKYRTSSGVRL